MTPVKSKAIRIPVLGFLALLAPYAVLAADEVPAAAALPIDLVTPERNAAVTQALRDKDALEQVISQLETSSGAYGAELSEAYFQLGSTENALEHYTEASEAYGKSLQSLKIGFGLHDLRQLPILEAMVATSETMEDWEEVDNLRHLIHFITTRSPDASPELRFQALMQLGRWKMRADADELLPENERSLEEAVRLYGNEIEKLVAGSGYDGKSIHVATLYLDLAGLELRQAITKYEMPISEFGVEGQKSTSTVTCITYQTRDGRTMQQCSTQEIPNPNYYFAPSNRKNMEIHTHLEHVHENVLEAYYALQDAPEGTSERTALLAEVQRLTKEYNDFVNMNSQSSMYRLD